MKPYILTYIFIITVGNVESARILGVFHAPAFSHQQLGNKLFYELAARGHEVSIITPFELKTPIKNVNIIKLDFPDFGDKQPNMFLEADKNAIVKILWLDVMGLLLTEIALNQTSVSNLLNSNQHFDVVIIEQFLNEAFKGFCYHFRAHCIMVSTIGSSRWTNIQMGNPASPSYVPDHLLSLSSKMNFCERLYNSFVNVVATLFSFIYTFPKHNQLLQKYFPNSPHLYDLYYNTSLMLLNSHVSTNNPVPFLPNMIEIGGFHVNSPKKLPKEIQEYLDSANDGVIYFSMGSNLKSKDMPQNKIDAIVKVFTKIKQKVLWKWENDTLPGQPPNVKIGKWLPQQDILAHPNVKVFVTHGGLLSTIETIYHGIPIIGIPIFGDQEMNIATAEIAGYAISVPYKELTEETFGQALEKVLNDPRYKENAKKRSKLMHDQPSKPLDRAMFWIEYVIRHQGALHFRSSALDLNWLQYLLLDVIGFVIFIFLICVIIVLKIIKMIFKKKLDTNKEKKDN